MKLRELFVAFGLNVDKASVNAAEKAVDGVKNAWSGLMKTLGAYLAVDALIGLFDSAVDAASAVDDLSQKIGVSAQALQELQYAAQLSGVDADALELALSTLTSTLGAAAQGDDTAAKRFSELGISVRDASGQVRTADVVLEQIADKMAAAGSQAERVAIAVDMFGARGKALAIGLKDGADGVRELRQESRELGTALSSETIAALTTWDDELDRLKMSARSLVAVVAAEFAEPMTAMLREVLAWWKANRVEVVDTIRRLPGLFTQAAKAVAKFAKVLAVVASTLVALRVGAQLYALATLRVAAANAIAGIAGSTSGLLTAAAWLKAAAATALTLLHMTAIAVRASAIGLLFGAIVVVIALIAEEIAALFTSTDGLFEKLRGKWGELTELILADADSRQSGIIKILETGLALVTSLIAGIDELTDKLTVGLADGLYKLSELDRQYQLTANVRKYGVVAGTINTASSAIAGSLGFAAAPNYEVNVNVDASGQSLNNVTLADEVKRAVNQGLADSHAQTRAALLGDE